MQAVEGIDFMEGATGRRATVAGTGLDVWEVISNWKAEGESFEGLRQSYPWLNQSQLHAALAYYQLFPAEIDERLRREAHWTPQRVRRELSRLRNPHQFPAANEEGRS